MPWRLKELIPEALKKAGGQAKLKRGLVLAAWKEVVGKELAGLTEAVGLEGSTLTVLVADPVTAHQLTYNRLLLLKRYGGTLPRGGEGDSLRGGSHGEGSPSASQTPREPRGGPPSPAARPRSPS